MASLEKDTIGKMDDKSFGLLFQNNYSKLCTFARDYIQNPEIAEEIVQDIFIKIWNLRENLVIKSSLRAYLYKMVHNHSLNYIRDHSTHKTIIEEKMDNLEILDNVSHGEIGNPIFESILSDEAEINLKHALLQLPEQCREIFIACRFDGLSYAEIAQKKSISVSTVKTQMGRAMEKLHAALKNHL
jgi:RNA polymerase sigma-70 factor, ECF subfamily